MGNGNRSMTDAGSSVDFVFYPKKNFLVNLQSQVVYRDLLKESEPSHEVDSTFLESKTLN